MNKHNGEPKNKIHIDTDIDGDGEVLIWIEGADGDDIPAADTYIDARRAKEIIKQLDTLFNVGVLSAIKDLLGAAVEYRDYEHDGDPWTEDARAMGEMRLDGMAGNGRIAECEKIFKGLEGVE